MKYSKILLPVIATLIAASTAWGQLAEVDGYTISAPNLRMDADSSNPWLVEGIVGQELTITVTLGNDVVVDDASSFDGFFQLVWMNPEIGDPANYSNGSPLSNVQIFGGLITIPENTPAVAYDAGPPVTPAVPAKRGTATITGKLIIPVEGIYRFEVRQGGTVLEPFSIHAIDGVRTGELTWGEIVSPVQDQRVNVTMPVEFSAEVYPLQLQSFTSVNYYIDGVLINTDGPVKGSDDGFFPYTWEKPYVGEHTLYAIAQLNNGSHIRLPNRRFTVLPIGSAPIVSIETPPGDGWVVGGDAQFSVFASDSGGVVENVDFIVNGVVVDTISRVNSTPIDYQRQPWTFQYRFPSTSPYKIYALIEFSTGNRARTNILRPMVGIGDRPVVRILSPINNMRFLPGTNLPILIQSWDRNSLIQEMSYFVNDTLVQTAVRGADGNFFPDPSSFSFNFPFPGDYRIYAQAIDHTGFITQSDIVTVRVENNDPTVPRVIMTHPLPVGGGDSVNDVSVGSSFYMNALATDNDGVIREVKFYINGQLVGVSNRHYQNTFSYYFEPTTPGSYIMFAEAIDNHGKRMHSAPLTLDVLALEANLPAVEMIPFEENRREVDSGSLVTFKARTFSGLVGVDQVNFYVDGVFVDSSETGDDDGVFSVDYIIKDAGTRLISARAIQINPLGLSTDNWVISDSIVLTVKPASGSRGFINRTYRDFYNLEPTQAYVDTEVQSLESGQKTQAQYVYEQVTLPSFLATQEVLMARILLTGSLPNWTMLRNDLTTYANGGLDAVVGFLLPTFQSTLWDNKRIPDAFSSDADFRSCFQLLFNQKYGMNATSAQTDRAVLQMKLFGTRGFVLEFLRDNDASIFGNGTISTILGLPNPPNSNLPDVATAAALQINLLRITPSLDEAKALGALSLPQQIDTVLNDSRYTSRN